MDSFLSGLPAQRRIDPLTEAIHGVTKAHRFFPQSSPVGLTACLQSPRPSPAPSASPNTIKIAAKVFIVLGLAAQAAYFSLQLSALLSPSWLTSTDQSLGPVQFSLTRCSHCSPAIDQFSPECILNVECEDTPGQPVCALAGTLQRARDMYFSAAVVSLVAALLSSLSAGYHLFGYYNGPKLALWTLLAGQTMAAVLAVVMWFGVMKAPLAAGGLQADIGPQISIAAAIVCCAGAGLLLYVSLTTTDRELPPMIGSQRVLGLSQRQWLLVKIVPLLFVSVLFDVCSLSYRWVRFSTSADHEGSLTTLDSVLSHRNVDYSCVADRACDDQTGSLENARNCEAFPRLYTGAVAYYSCEALSFVSLLLWTEGLLYFLHGTEYGVPLLNYVWPVLSVLLKGFGLCLWFAISGASFVADCEVTTAETALQFCAVEGPVYALWELVCLTTACAIYVALYAQRRRQDWAHGGASSSISPLFLEEVCKPQASEHCTNNADDLGHDLGAAISMDGFSNPNTSLERSSELKTSTADGTTSDLLGKEEKGMDCIACKGGKTMDDIRFELPCGHWCHIECFGVIGYNRKNCPKCQGDRQRDV